MHDITHAQLRAALKRPSSLPPMPELVAEPVTGIMSPETFASAHGITVVPFRVPEPHVVLTNGRQVLFIPDDDPRVTGLRVWLGIAIALLTRVPSDYALADAVFLAAELAAPAESISAMSVAELVEAQPCAPVWFLAEWWMTSRG